MARRGSASDAGDTGVAGRRAPAGGAGAAWTRAASEVHARSVATRRCRFMEVLAWWGAIAGAGKREILAEPARAGGSRPKLRPGAPDPSFGRVHRGAPLARARSFLERRSEPAEARIHVAADGDARH